LYTGGKTPGGLYDSTIIRSIYLHFSQNNYWSLLQNYYASKTDLPATLVMEGVTYDSVGVRFKGNTSYRTLPAGSQKTSFNLSIDYVIEDQRLMGYKTLNLNNAHLDPSFLREVFYLHQIRKYVPAAKANFVHLYINNADWGLYPNVQQLNKDFLEEWFLSNDGANWRADQPDGTSGGGVPDPGGPSWGDGTAALNYLGADTSLYQKYYTLKSSDINNPWSYLVDGCNALNNTPAESLLSVLPKYFDIDRVLWFLACEIAFVDDDSYVMKGKMDYYVYYEPETGRLTPIEFDGNTTMKMSAVNWSPFYNASKVNYPLLNKILAVPQWRQRYLAHLRTILNEAFDPITTSQILDNYKDQIDTLVQSDPKKLYSYTQFVNEINILKSFITTRRNNLLANAEVAQVAPTIQNVAYTNVSGQSWTAPAPNEATFVTAQVSATSGIHQVNLHYASGIVGNFTSILMYDDGQHRDGASGDGIFGASIPGQNANTAVRFYIEAIANNTAKSAAYMPVGAEHDVYYYKVQAGTSTISGVVINEFMASNSKTIQDETGDYDDWIELYNNNDFAINLGGSYITDNPANLSKWKFPAGTVIPARGYLMLWADEDDPDGAALHTNFKLSAGGEIIYLLDPKLNMIDSITFGVQTADMSYARVPNGTGKFVIQAATFNASNDVTTDVKDVISAAPIIHIYPNPANDIIHVILENTIKPQPVEIYNIMGQKIYAASIHSSAIINTTDWKPGVYVARIGHSSAQKFTIQR
ncbi:MAG: CotH kinase family protein, partial [Saprospiraceae bacterium]